jgi:hypothetical protein
MASDKFAVLIELSKRLDPKPVLVGGGAVELYTAGAFVTGDIDLIGDIKRVADALEEMGFVREGRHFVKGKIFIEVVAPTTGARTDEIKIQEKDIEGMVRVISIEDLIIDRLCACKWWRSQTDCEQARYLIGVYLDRCDRRYLAERARKEEVDDMLKEITGED